MKQNYECAGSSKWKANDIVSLIICAFSDGKHKLFCKVMSDFPLFVCVCVVKVVYHIATPSFVLKLRPFPPSSLFSGDRRTDTNSLSEGNEPDQRELRTKIIEGRVTDHPTSDSPAFNDFDCFSPSLLIFA